MLHHPVSQGSDDGLLTTTSPLVAVEELQKTTAEDGCQKPGTTTTSESKPAASSSEKPKDSTTAPAFSFGALPAFGTPATSAAAPQAAKGNKSPFRHLGLL